MKTGKWEYWRSVKDNLWYFHLKARNGKVILHSEGYWTEKGCKNGIKSIQTNVNAPIVKL